MVFYRGMENLWLKAAGKGTKAKIASLPASEKIQTINTKGKIKGSYVSYKTSVENEIVTKPSGDFNQDHLSSVLDENDWNSFIKQAIKSQAPHNSTWLLAVEEFRDKLI